MKILSILVAFSGAIPPCYAQDSNVENNTVETQEPQQLIDYKLEDACSTKLALAGLAIPFGIAGGIATGLKTGSIVAAGTLCIAPIALYAYLYKKYKNMFDEKRFSWVLTHAIEDKAFDYSMKITFLPIITLGLGLLALGSLTTIPATVIGLPVNVISTKLGIPILGAAFIGAGVMATLQAAYKTRISNIQHDAETYNKITWADTFKTFRKKLSRTAISATLVTSAVLGSMGILRHSSVQ